MPSEPIERYCSYFSELQPTNVARLADLVSQDFRFQDPFHQTSGPEAAIKAFRSMFRVADEVQFDFKEVIGSEQIYYLRWNCALVKGPKRSLIHGVSRVCLNASGKITEHIDYWDASTQFYMELPVLGTLLRWVQSRVKHLAS